VDVGASGSGSDRRGGSLIRGSGTRRPDGSRIRVEPPKPPAYHFEESTGLTAIEERVEQLLSERLAEFAEKIDTTQGRKSKRTRDDEGRNRYDFHAFD
jgi:hypothetical protein